MEKHEWIMDSDIQYKLVGRLLNCKVLRGDEHLIQKMLEEELRVPFQKPKNIENSTQLMIHNKEKNEPIFRYEVYSKDWQLLVRIGFESDNIARIIGYKKFFKQEKSNELGRRI